GRTCCQVRWRHLRPRREKRCSMLLHAQTCESRNRLTLFAAMKFRTLLSLSAFLAMFAFAQAEPLKVGDKAPAVSGVTESGTTINLGEVYKQQSYTLVYFYLKADTKGCTAQGCSLRDANVELMKKGVTIIGVSADQVDAQKAFKDKYSFPFTLI